MKTIVLLLIAATLEAHPIAFTNVNVIPMTGDQVLRDQVVIVDGERIVAIGAAGEVRIPDDAQRIDGEGGFLVPGLIDLHVHLHQSDELISYVAAGVTTVFNLAGDPGVFAYRRAPLGPRVFTTGEQIVDVQSAEQARAVVAADAAAGYDAIKIYDKISIEALGALIDEAHKRGMLAVGHIPRNLRWQDMLAARPDAIAHAEEFLYSPVGEGDDARIVSGMKEGGISLITTLIAYDDIGRQAADLETMLARGENAYLDPAVRRMWDRRHNVYVRTMPAKRVPKLRRLLAFQKTLIGQLHAASVPILLGTDAGGPPFDVGGFSAIQELRELVSAGLTPYAAMRAATAEAARFLRRASELGTIERGKIADLVLLRGNPLADIDNADVRAGVMLRGRWLDNAALHAELDRVARINRAEEPVVRAMERGAAAVLAAMKTHPVRQLTLNELAYQLLRVDDKPADAVTVFRANVARHPESWEAWDSLADGLEGDHKKNEAETARRRSKRLRDTEMTGAPPAGGPGPRRRLP